MKRLLKNSIYVVIIAAILVMASRAFGERSISISGDTPLQKINSLVKVINEKKNYQGFAQLSLRDYDMQNQTVVLVVMVSGALEEIFSTSDTAQTQKFFALVQEVFVKTAQIGGLKELVLNAQFIDTGEPLTFFADEERLKSIRSDPENWLRYVIWPYFLPVGSEEKRTPSERVGSLVYYLNEAKEYQGFARVSFLDYEIKNQSWRFSITVFQNPEAVFSGEEGEIFFRLLRELFVNTAQFGESKEIMVAVWFAPAGSAGEEFIFFVDEAGIEKIKKYPKDWRAYVGFPYPLSLGSGEKSQREKSEALVYYLNKKHKDFAVIFSLGYQEKFWNYSVMFTAIAGQTTILDQTKYLQVMGDLLKGVAEFISQDEGIAIQNLFFNGAGELYYVDAATAQKIKQHPKDWQLYVAELIVPTMMMLIQENPTSESNSK